MYNIRKETKGKIANLRQIAFIYFNGTIINRPHVESSSNI